MAQYGQSQMSKTPNALDYLKKKEQEKKKFNLFDFSDVTPKPQLNFGPGMSGPGITNFQDFKASIPQQVPQTQPTQKSGFSLVPTANAMEEEDLLQQYLKDPKQDNESKQQLFQALQDGENPDDIINYLQTSGYKGTQPQAPQDINDMGLLEEGGQRLSNLGTKLGERAGRIGEDFTRERSKNPFIAGGQNLLAGVGSAGEIIGGLGDIAFEGLAYATPDIVKEGLYATGRGIKAITPEPVKKGLVSTGKAIGEEYKEFKKDSPFLARGVEGTGNIATVLPIAKGGKVVGKGIEKTGEVLTKGGKQVLITPTLIKQGVENIKPGLSPQELIRRTEAEKLAGKYGIELPASSVSGPKASKVEQILGEGLFGGKIKQRAENAIDKFKQVTSQVQKGTKGDTELGENIVKSFTDLEKQKKTIIDDLYKSAEDLTRQKGGEIKIDAGRTEEFVKELIKREEKVFEGLQDNQVINNLTSIAKGAKPQVTKIKTGILGPDGKEIIRTITKQPTLENYRETLKVIGDKANFNSFNPTTTEKNFRNLYYTLKNDIDASIGNQVPEIKATLEKANKEFKAFQELKERPFVKTIQKYADLGDYDKVTQNIVNPKISANEVAQVYSNLGKGVKQDIQKKIINDIIEKSKNADGEFTPMGFSKQMKNIGDEKLNAILNPGQVKMLKELEQLNSLIQKAGTVARGSQTAPIQQLMGAVKGLAAFTTAGTSLALEYALAKYIGSKSGQALLKRTPKILIPNQPTNVSNKTIKKPSETGRKVLKKLLPSNFKEKAQDLVDKIAEKTGAKTNLLPTNSKQVSKVSDDLKIPESINKFDKKETQVVYHGSKYDFDTFETGRIGTGEGNTGFGEGIYFADKGGAKGYADKLETYKGEGKVYKVEIPNDKYLLDLDKYISKQSPYIQNKMSNILNKYKNDLKGYSLDSNGSSIYKALENKYGSQKATDILNENGIKGNVFNFSEGERYQVIFDDKYMKNLGKEKFILQKENIDKKQDKFINDYIDENIDVKLYSFFKNKYKSNYKNLNLNDTYMQKLINEAIKSYEQATKPKLLKPKQVSKVSDDLIKEARKYKSADEFASKKYNNISFKDYLKIIRPDIKQNNKYDISFKDGTKYELNVNDDGDITSLFKLFKDGTKQKFNTETMTTISQGPGGPSHGKEIVDLIKDWALNTRKKLYISDSRNNKFWKANGFEDGREWDLELDTERYYYDNNKLLEMIEKRKDWNNKLKQIWEQAKKAK